MWLKLNQWSYSVPSSAAPGNPALFSSSLSTRWHRCLRENHRRNITANTQRSLWDAAKRCNTHAGWEVYAAVLTLWVPQTQTSSSAVCPSPGASVEEIRLQSFGLNWRMGELNVHSHHMPTGDSWLSDWGSQTRWRSARFWFHWRPAARDVSSEERFNWNTCSLRCHTHLIPRVQHDFYTFVGGADIRSKLYTSCREKNV